MVSIFWILAGIGLFFLSVLLNKSGVNKKKLLREAYEDALKSKNKKIALDAGRRYYASIRKEGNLTVYDEQAIANDINAMDDVLENVFK